MIRVPIKAMADDAFPAEGYHARIENGHVDEEGAWFPTEGAKRIRDFGVGHEVIGLFEWTRRGNQRWLVIESVEDNETTNVFYYDWRANTVVLITTRRHNPANPVGTTFLAMGLWLYMLTPGDTPIRWDGQRIERVGFTTPNPPVVSGPSGGFIGYDSTGANESYSARADPVRQRGVGPYPETDGTAQPWRRGYAVTWLNAVGSESPPSPIVITSGTNPATASSGLGLGRQAVFVEVPSGPAEAVAGRLWCTSNLQDVDEPTSATLYLVDEFAHAAGHSYIDLTPEGELTTVLATEELGEPPVRPATGCVWAGFLWLVDGDDPTLVRRSSLLLQEQFPVEGYVSAGSASSGAVVALVPVQRALLIFKERGVFALIDADAAPRVISEGHGTNAPKAIAVVPGVGVFFLDTTAGPCLVYGTMQDEQSTGIRVLPGIRRTWRHLVGRMLASSRVLYDPETREVWWSVPTGGNSRNTLSIVWHLLTEGWSIRPDWPVDSMLITTTGHILAGTRQLQPGLDILTYGEDARDAVGSAVEMRIWTQWFESLKEMTFMAAELIADGVGSVTVDVATRADRRPTDLDQTESGKQLVHPDHDRDAWGTALWGSAYLWTETEPARVVVDLHDRTFAHSYQLRLNGSRLRLYSLNLHDETERALPYRRERAGGSLP